MARLTILCENTAVASVGILGEHGFAVLIEKEEGSFLFDTGQGRTIIHNAACLGKDLSGVRTILLSHGHYDHTGGLKNVLDVTGPINVYAHPDIFLEKIAVVEKKEHSVEKYVGIPERRDVYEARGARFVFNRTFTEIAADMYLTGEIPRRTSFEKQDRRLMIKKDGRLVQDYVNDDQSLVIKTPVGLIVVLGCAHSGVVNTLNHVKAHMPGLEIYMVVGGTHVGFLTEAQVRSTIDALHAFSIQKIGASHCTGLGPAMKLKQAFGDRFFFANAGSMFEI